METKLKKHIILSLLTSMPLLIGSAAFADSDGMTFAERQTVYKIAGQGSLQAFDHTASLTAPRQHTVYQKPSPFGRWGRDLAITDDEM